MQQESSAPDLDEFRRGHRSELFEAGAAPAVVLRQLRHGDARVTLEHYSQVIGGAQRSAANRLASLIEQQLESNS